MLPSRPPGLIPSRFHPWGLTLRGFTPRLAPYALSKRRAPQGLSSTKKEETALSGTLTPDEAPTTDPGTSQMTASTASLGFPAPRFAALNGEERSHALSSPLALSRLGRTLTEPLAPQGFFPPKTWTPLSRDGPTSMQFFTSLLFSTLRRPRRTGLWVSLRGQPASPRAHPHLCPAVRSPA